MLNEFWYLWRILVQFEFVSVLHIHKLSPNILRLGLFFSWETGREFSTGVENCRIIQRGSNTQTQSTGVVCRLI